MTFFEPVVSQRAKNNVEFLFVQWIASPKKDQVVECGMFSKARFFHC